MEKTRYGISRDLQQLRAGATASAAELREFLKDMKGKNPHEVLGSIAQSSLMQSMVVATIGTAALLAVGSVVPYFLSGGKPAVAAAPAAVQPATTPANGTTPAGNQAAGSQTAGQPGGAGPNASNTQPSMSELDGPGSTDSKKKQSDDILDRLGVGEDKMADPNINPLDKGDDVLKDIK